VRAEPLAVIPVANLLGEGIVWDARGQAFVWTDILASRLYRLVWGIDTPTIIDLPERLGSFALTDDPAVIIAAFASGFARYHLETGQCEWLARPELPPGVRFNDGRTDRLGHFVAGTMVEDADRAGGTDRGVLYRLEDDNSLSELHRGFHISNSLCWSPDGRSMYHADSPAQAITAYGYDSAGARYQRVLASFDVGHPDGATVDAAGRIWVAMWGAGCVNVLDPAGARLMTIPLGASQPTCPALGGPNLDILAVTSARTDLSDAALANEPDAGAGGMFRGLIGHGMNIWMSTRATTAQLRRNRVLS
jgi:sugar lactone lactonase YvrE